MKSTRLLSFIAVSAITFTACNKQIKEEVPKPDENCQSCTTEQYVSPTGDKGIDATGTFEGRTVDYKVIDRLNILEGDIIMPSKLLNQPHPEGTITTISSRYWPNRTVYYRFASGISQATRDKFLSATREWINRVGFRFVQRTNQANYINVVEGGGCSSVIGMSGGAQNLSLASGCSVGNAIHEIGHAIGLFHEQSRPDRDRVVTIKFGNITPGLEGNFRVCSNCTANGSLDLGSIMMYGSFFFSRNGQPTITRKDGSTFTIQRRALSTNDIAVVNSRYR
jgi:hypothetical protein